MSKTIKEYSKKYYKYIEDNILPYDDQNLQIEYLKGEMGYDEQYVKEHMANNNIELTDN